MADDGRVSARRNAAIPQIQASRFSIGLLPLDGLAPEKAGLVIKLLMEE
jgi:hypothetical protein